METLNSSRKLRFPFDMKYLRKISRKSMETSLAQAIGGLKVETLWRFSTSIVTKQRKIEGGPYGEKQFQKNLTMLKKRKEGPFGIIKHPFCRKTSKKGDPSTNFFS